MVKHATQRSRHATTRLIETFGALRHRHYRVFWAGTCVSFIGTWVQNVALGLYVYQLTQSKQALGVVGLASGLPITFLLLYGGAVADRLDRRRLLLVTQSLYALSAFLLAALVATGAARVWHIVAISFFNGLIFAVDGPTRQAMVYDLVGAEDLATGVALQSASFNVARVLGPAIGSAIYASLGPAWCFAINGVSFGAVLVAVSVIRASAGAGADVKTAPADGIRSSLRYLRDSVAARTVLLLTATASVCAVANYQTLMPAIARERLAIGEQDPRYGFLFSAIGVGSLLAAYVVGRNARAGRRGMNVVGGALLLGAALIGLGYVRLYPVALAAFLLVGLAAVTQLASANSLTQTLAPAGLRARAVALHMMAMAGLQPVGAAIAGTIAQRYGVSASLTTGGAVLVLVAMIVGSRRRDVVRLP